VQQSCLSDRRGWQLWIWRLAPLNDTADLTMLPWVRWDSCNLSRSCSALWLVYGPWNKLFEAVHTHCCGSCQSLQLCTAWMTAWRLVLTVAVPHAGASPCGK
jgi:hypothetical protein